VDGDPIKGKTRHDHTPKTSIDLARPLPTHRMLSPRELTWRPTRPTKSIQTNRPHDVFATTALVLPRGCESELTLFFRTDNTTIRVQSRLHTTMAILTSWWVVVTSGWARRHHTSKTNKGLARPKPTHRKLWPHEQSWRRASPTKLIQKPRPHRIS
jgi:hypothetical protein